MNNATFLGEFPQVAFALMAAFGSALGIAFLVLRVIVGFVMRERCE